MHRYALIALAAASPVPAVAQVKISSTIETYFISNTRSRGLAHSMSWAEFHTRFSPQLRLTTSFSRFGSLDTYDEVCLEFESGQNLVRAGRLRTNFGFSNWSELFYNGFNARPLVRSLAMTPSIRLTRNDVGLEWTTGTPSLQGQLALLDSTVASHDVKFKKLRATTARVQTTFNNSIIGFDLHHNWDQKDDVYGLDFRSTWPRFQLNGEAFAGAGSDRSASGYYLDGIYRVKGLLRTQAVGRTEAFRVNSKTFYAHTLGVRQLLGSSIGMNLNYVLNDGSRPPALGSRLREGWTIQGTYRVTF